MDALQYVHVDVPAENLCEWMPYYTHHSDTDVPQYVPIDVTLGAAVAWMS